MLRWNAGCLRGAPSRAAADLSDAPKYNYSVFNCEDTVRSGVEQARVRIRRAPPFHARAGRRTAANTAPI